MKALYLARVGKRQLRWVVSDGEEHLVGTPSWSRQRCLSEWVRLRGWPALLVTMPGVYPTLKAALAARLTDNLRTITEIVQAAANRLGAPMADIWQEDQG